MRPWVRDLAENRLPAFRRNPVVRWGAGIGVFVAAFLLRFALEGTLPPGLPFITFFVAVLLATLVGGIAVGLAVLAASSAASWYFFVPPRYSFALGMSGAFALIAFALFGSVIVAIVHQLNLTVGALLNERRRSDALLTQKTRAEEKISQLNRELLHRIRNIFTLATSIASQTARSSATPIEMTNSLAGRFQALAVAQELLVANDLAGAELKRLVTQLLEPFSPTPERLNVEGPSQWISADLATSLCLVLHELATNAAKYGAWSNSNGKVRVGWTTHTNASSQLATITWSEENGPPCALPQKTGLGTLLIDKAIAGASVEREFHPGGLRCTMQFSQTS